MMMISQWYELIKCGLIIFLLICRKDHEVPTDAHDSRDSGGVSDCNSRRCGTMEHNYKGNTQNIDINSSKTDSVAEKAQLTNALFLFWQCCKWVLQKMTISTSLNVRNHEDIPPLSFVCNRLWLLLNIVYNFISNLFDILLKGWFDILQNIFNHCLAES